MKSVIEVKQGVAVCVREDTQFFFGRTTMMEGGGDNYEKKLFYF